MPGYASYSEYLSLNILIGLLPSPGATFKIYWRSLSVTNKGNIDSGDVDDDQNCLAESSETESNDETIKNLRNPSDNESSSELQALSVQKSSNDNRGSSRGRGRGRGRSRSRGCSGVQHMRKEEREAERQRFLEAKWKAVDKDPIIPDFTWTPGIQVELPDEASEIDFMSLFFTNELFYLLVTHQTYMLLSTLWNILTCLNIPKPSRGMIQQERKWKNLLLSLSLSLSFDGNCEKALYFWLLEHPSLTKGLNF